MEHGSDETPARDAPSPPCQWLWAGGEGMEQSGAHGKGAQHGARRAQQPQAGASWRRAGAAETPSHPGLCSTTAKTPPSRARGARTTARSRHSVGASVHRDPGAGRGGAAQPPDPRASSCTQGYPRCSLRAPISAVPCTKGAPALCSPGADAGAKSLAPAQERASSLEGTGKGKTVSAAVPGEANALLNL